MRNNSELKYKGIKLIPSIFSELMIEQFDGKRFRRKDAIQIIENVFVQRGGTLEGVNGITNFKKAASYLKPMGLSNPSYGFWELNYKKQTTEVIKKVKTKAVNFNEEIGNGSQSVYVYYFDVYKQLANVKNENKWPCKIGMTEDDPYARIGNQEKTVFPDKPVLALLIHTPDARKCEKAIHSILEFKNKKLVSPGNEWYLTNIDEIISIFQFIDEKNSK